MARIAFVTDSTAGLPVDQAEKYRVTVVPLQVIFGIEVFRDGIDLTEDQFFERLKAAKKLPTTSQPTTGDFEEAYAKLLEDPEVDSIISVHISSGLSGTYGAAAAAAERLRETGDKKITVVDSLSGYMGEGLMVINGARAAEQGKSHDEIVKVIEAMIPKVRVLLLVDTLEYLQRGGRIGGAQALIGGLLNVKPILHIHNGVLEPLERVRTRRKAMERLAELGGEATGGRPCQVVVGHAQAAEDARALSGLIHQKMNVVEEFSSPLGPVISTHAGPGVLGFVYYPLEDRPAASATP
jgi:DegV family protein with EDD domain